MMTDQNTFTADNGDQGTTKQFSSNTDNSNTDGIELGSKLQQQIDVMQKRIGDKDDFINTLQGENQTLREKMLDIEARLESMGSVEDALSKMDAAKNSSQETNLDEETLVSKVLGKMEARTVEERAEANFKTVQEKLTKTFGADKVDQIVEQAAKENALSFDDMIALAKKSPQAVYKMVGVNTTATRSASPSQSTHVGYSDDVNSKEQKLAAYSKLRKENPREFYSPEVQKAFRLACLSND